MHPWLIDPARLAVELAALGSLGAASWVAGAASTRGPTELELAYRSNADLAGALQHAHGDDATGAMDRSPLGPYPATRDASGTSWAPDSSAMHGIHFAGGGWSWMFHAHAVVAWNDQSGPRGDEELFSSNMAMLAGHRPLGPGRLRVRAMLSLEPATIGERGYPLLFQTGETANGRTPLVDAQHPHDLFMELSGSYAVDVGPRRSLFVYAGLPGEPALGPPSFMHRFSGMEMPAAPLGHHWLDSTHISFGVITAGATWGAFKLDASAFNGREPDEHRWDIETDRLDSQSVRLTFQPAPRWSLQASVGDLHAPEQLEPDVDTVRATASAMYDVAWDENRWAATLAVGRNDDDPGGASDAWLLESAFTWANVHTWLARLERVEQSELFPAGDPLAGEELDVEKLSLGYLREIAALGSGTLAVGALGSVHRIDDDLEDAYGEHPRSLVVFLRARW